jgi:hypothetical protein
MSTHTLLLYFIQNRIMVGFLFHFPFNIWFLCHFSMMNKFHKVLVTESVSRFSSVCFHIVYAGCA